MWKQPAKSETGIPAGKDTHKTNTTRDTDSTSGGEGSIRHFESGKNAHRRHFEAEKISTLHSEKHASVKADFKQSGEKCSEKIYENEELLENAAMPRTGENSYEELNSQNLEKVIILNYNINIHLK